MFYDSDIYLVEWRESRWLVLTSIGSLIPTAYSFYYGLYFFSAISLFTTFFSANYWRKATISYRRDMDLVYAKLSFFIYLSHGLYYVQGYRMIVFSPGLIYLIYNYYYSNQLYYEKKREWLSHHIWFHIMVIMEQMAVLESICHENKMKIKD
jgi:hypothetical protein